MDERARARLLTELERIFSASGGNDNDNDVSLELEELSDEIIDTLSLLKEASKSHIDETRQNRNTLNILSSIVNNFPSFVAYRTFEGTCLYVNPAASEMTGYTEEELRDDYLGLLFGTDVETLFGPFKEKLLEKGVITNEHPVTLKDGRTRIYSGTSFIIGNDTYATLITDVTDARTVEAEREQALRTMATILHGIDAMIYVTVPETGEILFINDRMREHYGLDENVIGQFCYKVLQENINERCSFCPCIHLDENPDDVVVWEETSTKTLQLYRNTDRYIDWHDGRKVHVQYSTDITEITRTANSLKKAIIEKDFDMLTGLYNRRYFAETFPLLVLSLSRSSSPLSLMMLDIDFFKNYNDTYGHPAGDECLKVVADILTNCLPRKDDFVTRYGGEEFVIVLPNTDEVGAKKIADKLLKCMKDAALPHKSSNIASHVTFSIGITTAIAKHFHSVDDYINLADEMLYKSKQSGRNMYSFKPLGK